MSERKIEFSVVGMHRSDQVVTSYAMDMRSLCETINIDAQNGYRLAWIKVNDVMIWSPEMAGASIMLMQLGKNWGVDLLRAAHPF